MQNADDCADIVAVTLQDKKGREQMPVACDMGYREFPMELCYIHLAKE